MAAILSQQLNDAQLITDYVQGDEHALEMLIEKYQQRIINFIFSKINDRD